MDYDLTELEHSVTIFEIDNPTLRTTTQFLHTLDTRRALGHMTAPINTGMGAWKGKMNTCFVMATRDFYQTDNQRIIRLYTGGQDCFMEVSNTGAVSFVTPSGADAGGVGRITKLDPSDLDAQKGFTILKTGFYGVTS